MKNAKLANLFCLSHKITVYVPATNGVNHAADNSAEVAETAALMAEKFGGSTSTNAIGYWLSPACGLVAENTTMVFAYAAEDALADGLDAVVEHCEKLRDEMGQECVALELDGAMYFI